MSDTSIKYLHLRAEAKDFTLSSFGGLTVAYRLDQVNNLIHYAVACVNHKDRYTKKIGCALAAERLNAGTDITKCGTVTLDDFSKNCVLPISPQSFSKLNVVDFNWYTTTSIIIQVVLADERFSKFAKNHWQWI